MSRAGEAGTTLRIDIIDRSRAISLGHRAHAGAAQTNEQQQFGMKSFVDIPDDRKAGMAVSSGTLDIPAIQQALEAIPMASTSDKVEVGLEIIPQ